MDRNRNWQGWAAIALAGLALLVALGGRGPWGGGQMSWGRGEQQYAAPPAPAAPQGPGNFRPEQDGQGRGHGDFRFAQGQTPPRFFGAGPQGGPVMHGRGHPGIFGIFKLLSGLTKLVALGLLGWLLLRLFTQRRNTPPAAAPTTPAGHDPRVE
jgi:hypothetical protein